MLRGLVSIIRANHVWDSDITYITDGARLSVSGGDYRLGQPGVLARGAVVETMDTGF